MKGLLHKRKRLSVVRLEFQEEMSQELQDYLTVKLKIKPNQMYESKSPLSFNECKKIAIQIEEEKRNHLLYKPYIPQNPIEMRMDESVMKQVEKKDVLLSYPYESMEPFLRLVKEASEDKGVLSIKITIYRLASHPKLVDYLCRASENGIAVTVLIELRARFDESKNIYWSERLEASGCHIIYGVEAYKVHSKICLITKKLDGNISYITQVGTGNYNESTAKLYTDLSLITANEEIGMDAVAFFQNMGMGNLNGQYQHLLVGPYQMKNSLLALIDEQISLGEKGYIGIKINGLADEVLMAKMNEASKVGVKVDLCVRGVCCLLPGVEGETENIKIQSIVGRFLEHSRIYIFGKGEESKVYIASADWLHRNTDRRVEVAVPIYDREVKSKVSDIFNLSMKDTMNGRKMQSDGEFSEHTQINIEKVDSQEILMK